MARGKTHTQFVAELAITNPTIEVLGIYTKSVNRVLVRCKKCGCEWQPVAAELTRGRGCPSCRGNKPPSQEEFVRRMKQVNPNIEVTGKYIRSNKKIECRCLRCKHTWSAVPGSLLSGHGCPNCARRANGVRRRKSHEQFVSELMEVNPELEVIGRYKSSSSPIEVRCKRCGFEWSPTARNVIYGGQGCPLCSRADAAAKNLKDPQVFISEMQKVNSNIKILGEYRGNKTKIACQCKVCSNKWEAAPSNLLHGYGCPRCARTSTSFMEQFLVVFLERILGQDEVISRDKSAIDRELDIYIPTYRLAVEIGSWYWHKKRLKSDIWKEAECRNKGITLITVYDCCPNPLPSNVPKGSILYPFSLAEEDEHASLCNLAIDIANRIGAYVPEDFRWADIESEASKRALPKTTAEFVAEIAIINSDIEVLGDYIGSKNKLLCRCKKCNHTWKTTPGQLLAGQGCPPCGHTNAALKGAALRRKTPEEYRKEFESTNPSLSLMSEYVNSLQAVKVKCNVCGHEWSPRAEAIIRGNGCPICADNSKRKPHDVFLEELRSINPNIEVLGQYTKNSNPIECSCKKCGYVWNPRPSKLLNGSGCPKCAGKMKTQVRCIETGIVYESYSSAAAALGLKSGDSISAVCKGKRKTAAGYRWEYVK